MSDERLIYDINGLRAADIVYTARHLGRLIAKPFRLNGATRAWWADDVKEWLECQANDTPYTYRPKPAPAPRPAPRRRLIVTEQPVRTLIEPPPKPLRQRLLAAK